MTSTVEYGLTETYGESKESSTQTKEHEITITGLKQNTEYHLRVKGEDSLNNLYSSGDYTFTPKSPPLSPTSKVTKTPPNTKLPLPLPLMPPTPRHIHRPTSSTEDSRIKIAGTQGKPDLTTNHSTNPQKPHSRHYLLLHHHS